MTSIVIRRGAERDTVTIQNHAGAVTVDQRDLTNGQRHDLRRQIVEVFAVERGLVPAANDNHKPRRPRRQNRRNQRGK